MMKLIHRFTNVAAVFVLVVVFVFGVCQNATARNWLQPADEMVENLVRVFKISKDIGNPETLQAILLQESGGQTPALVSSKPSLTKSYGLMQVQINSAKSVLSKFPELMEKYFPQRNVKSLTNKEVMDLLVTDKDANIRIAAYHFNLYLEMSDGNWDRAVAAYNVGIGAVKHIGKPEKFKYVKAIRTTVEAVHVWDTLNGLVDS